jgi:hypothetical protein
LDSIYTNVNTIPTNNNQLIEIMTTNTKLIINSMEETFNKFLEALLMDIIENERKTLSIQNERFSTINNDSTKTKELLISNDNSLNVILNTIKNLSSISDNLNKIIS